MLLKLSCPSFSVVLSLLVSVKFYLLYVALNKSDIEKEKSSVCVFMTEAMKTAVFTQ